MQSADIKIWKKEAVESFEAEFPFIKLVNMTRLCNVPGGWSSARH